MNALSVIQLPNGRYGFVGRVPDCLAVEGDADLREAARQCGMGIARRIAERTGRKIRNRSWASLHEALKAAEDAGYEVTCASNPI